MKKLILLLFIAIMNDLYSQNFYEIAEGGLKLNNGFIQREISIAGDSIYSSQLSLGDGKQNYISKSREISFLLNGKAVDGFSGWEFLSSSAIQDENSGKGVNLILKCRKKEFPVQIEINYMLYPGLPLIRKWISFTNKGPADMKLEALNIEDIQTVLSGVTTVVYHNYGRMKHIGSFTGTWDDPVIAVHDITHRRGIAVGNESPSIIKRTAYHTVSNNIEAGLTHLGQDYPFRKWLKPGESWESPQVFICLYENSDNGFDVIGNEVNRFVVENMRPRIYQLKDKPIFVYNTWNPFRTFINDALVREIAASAAECGIQEFIIDDGWQVNTGGATSTLGWGNNYGDWKVDEKKFPGGLRPTFDYIKSLGMKPGLWISVGSATKESKVYQEHPEWFVKNKDNRPGDLHLGIEPSDFSTSCFGTEWFGYIKSTILRLVKDYGLAYAKLDFSVVTSAYVNDPAISGCYAMDHPWHRDHEESFIVIYERILKLFDELHTEAPELFIDCTFETAGKLQLMDYAIAKDAEGNWLSNFEEPSPLGPLRIRQMAWWRSPAVPASSLVIGNLAMDDPDFEFGLKSLIGTLPIVLGDPRALTPEKRRRIREWSDWMKAMQSKYDYMTYRKDLPGFGEPAEGTWDGWMRINFQNRSGGIFGIFRQGALEDTRQVFLKDLNPGKEYIIRLAPQGTEVMRGKGKALMEEGFRVTLKKYDANIYEVGVVE
jgi:alpha-galactosidase